MTLFGVVVNDKVRSQAFWSAVMAVLVWALHQFAKIEIPPAISGAAIVIIGTFAGFQATSNTIGAPPNEVPIAPAAPP